MIVSSTDTDIVKAEPDALEMLMQAKDPGNVKDIVGLFNLAQAKKSAVRIDGYNNLLDMISEQMMRRFIERPNEFSHKDLMDYMNTVGNMKEKEEKNVSKLIDTPPVSIQQQINIVNADDGISKDSRDRVIKAVKALLKNIDTMHDENAENEIVSHAEEINQDGNV